MDYRKIIADEIDYQRKRLYKRLKTSDNGRLIVEYWRGAENFLNTVHGIDWKLQGRKILIKEKKEPMKTFVDILNEAKFKIGDKVKILDSPAHRKHGQKGGIGKTGEIDAISGSKIWVKFGDVGEERKGMGYEVATMQVEPKDLKKLKESEDMNLALALKKVLIQLSNDEASSDKAMIQHLLNQLKIELNRGILTKKNVENLVKKGRDKIMADPLRRVDDQIKILTRIM